ncbi:zinc finger protein 271-like [Sardina pilchardus]|uniref:zinc finger protein 271-like n=1 Tax=Sardina pilchardus TaxID=27697 RepID=UPI002E0E4AD4
MDTSPSVLSIRLLVPPLRLLTGFMWQVAHHQHVEHFGKLEHFVSVVLKRLPDLLSPRQKSTLIMGLRTKMLLENCRGDVPADLQTIRSHLSEIQARLLRNSKNSELENLQRRLLELVLSLLEDPVEKEYFFKKVYPVEYGPDFDKALQVLVGYFISRLEKSLPVPNFKQVSSLIDSSSLWDECEQHLNQLEQLHTLHQDAFSGPLGESDLPSIVEDRIMSSLSFQCASGDGHSRTNLQRMPSLDSQLPTSKGPRDAKQKLHSHDQSHRDLNMTSNVLRVRDVQKQAGTSINKKQGDVCVEDGTEFDRDKKSVMDEDNDGAPVELTAKHPSLTVAQNTEENLTMAPPKPEVNPALLQQEEVLVLPDVSSNNSTNNAVKGAVAEVTCHNAVQQGQDTLRVAVNKPKDVCKQYKCVTCGLRLPSRGKWHRHRRIHLADKPSFTCAHCGREFTRQSSLTNHQQFCSQPSRLHDTTNSESSPASAPAKTDTGAVAEETCYNAVQQGQEDTMRVDIDKLKNVCKQYKCVTCGLRMASREKWRRHQRIHMADKQPFTCAHCGREFKRLSSLTNHQQAGANQGGDSSQPPCLQPRRNSVSDPASAPAKTDPGRCQFCGETFSEVALRLHLKTHPEYRPYHCSECDKDFTSTIGLKTHRQRLHTAEKPYLCSECGRWYQNRYMLKRHMEFHAGRNKFYCSFCGKQYTNQANLTIHIRSHTGEKPYVCSQCGKAFGSAGVLQVHMRIHTGERPYRCEVCDLRCINSSQFRRHARVHSGERPFTCVQCKKGFSTNSCLKKHMFLHTGMKPYKCPMCPKSYCTRNHLNRHAITHREVVQ